MNKWISIEDWVPVDNQIVWVKSLLSGVVLTKFEAPSHEFLVLVDSNKEIKISVLQRSEVLAWCPLKWPE